MRLWLLTAMIGASILGARSGEAGVLGSTAKSISCYTDCTTGELSKFLHPSTIMPGQKPVISTEQKEWLETCLKCRNNVDSFMTKLEEFLEAKKDRPKIDLICKTAEKLANNPKDYPHAQDIHQFYCGGRKTMQSTTGSRSPKKLRANMMDSGIYDQLSK